MKEQVQAAGKSGRLAIVIAFFALLLGGIWAVSQSDAESGRSASFHQDDLANDTNQLWRWADSSYKGGSAAAEWTIRWDIGNPAGQLTLEETVKQFTANNEQNQGKLIADEGDYITISIDEFGGTLTMHELPKQEQQPAGSRFLLLFQPDEGKAAVSSILAIEQKIKAWLKEEGASYKASLSAKGVAAGRESAEKLAKAAGAKPVERYEDDGTSSVSYWSPKLHSSVKVGKGKDANLQLAIHQQTDSKDWFLTAGSPLITGDYSLTGPL
ncbi:YwmB family TATA-box binding protein [Paenibacillus protaetiae]|uniref:TATA-box binding protein n=1 Tax=Paenibacillus protaetiae TaxID=2509456 RepID=A0A4V0YF83_9BACL|nr:YwmB family TATA-box binding protein [Paenibacillus protaetiae]QAY66811.1 hypothetical protein ET464_10720 [Paenibacillus protaetiae]